MVASSKWLERLCIFREITQPGAQQSERFAFGFDIAGGRAVLQ